MYIGQNTAVIIGGLRLAGNRMIRPYAGNVFVLKFHGQNGVQVIDINSDLHISGHSAVEQGEYLYIFGGYEANCPNGDVQPSQKINRINITSLREGNLVIENHEITQTFKSSYV